MSIMADIASRQTQIPLFNIKYCIVLGIGGIGSWVALDMALSGKVKNLVLIDPDTIEESNLNRTPYRIRDVGALKVDAMKYLILERRACNVITYAKKTSIELAEKIKEEIDRRKYTDIDPQIKAEYKTTNVVVDCRDDIYTDFYSLPCKYYKIGYDGLSITVDGDPQNTPVWGRANGYRTVPSFICPSQLAANLIVSDILVIKREYDGLSATRMAIPRTEDTKPFDSNGRLNDCYTFNSTFMLEDIMQISKGEST